MLEVARSVAICGTVHRTLSRHYTEDILVGNLPLVRRQVRFCYLKHSDTGANLDSWD